jgi:PPK2 family polyphosphate:nucleotide phosphotransferase
MEKSINKKIHKFIEPYCITKGKDFRLKDIDPDDTGHLKSEFEEDADEVLKKGIELLADLQEKLYAQDRWAVLLIFQAMDAAGKDSTIKHVMSGVNPTGVEVYSFKAPTSEDLDHDFMWRCMKRLPERGRIGIFNRSYYEEVLVVRVHEEILKNQKIPQKLIHKNIWEERFEDIRNVERYLTRNGIVILKFFLHASKKEQKERFLKRLNEPAKNWKFSIADVKERGYWEDYQHAYEDMIRNTATKRAPWFVVPADNKWFTRLVVAGAVVETLRGLDLKFPTLDKAKLKELETVRAALESQKNNKK